MLTAATGLNREALRGPVATALRRVLKDQGTVYENMRGAGYRRVDDADLANIGQRAIEKGRRVHAVAVGAADERSWHIVRETILGVLIQTASRGTISKAERAAQRAYNQPDAAQQQVGGLPSIRLGPSLKDHVEGALRRPSNPRKPAVANDLGELGLTRLRTQAFAYFLVQ